MKKIFALAFVLLTTQAFWITKAQAQVANHTVIDKVIGVLGDEIVLLSELEKGDKIVTTGGLHAEVVKVEEDFIKIKLNDTSIVKLDKAFVNRKVEA